MKKSYRIVLMLAVICVICAGVVLADPTWSSYPPMAINGMIWDPVSCSWSSDVTEATFDEPITFALRNMTLDGTDGGPAFDYDTLTCPGYGYWAYPEDLPPTCHWTVSQEDQYTHEWTTVAVFGDLRSEDKPVAYKIMC